MLTEVHRSRTPTTALRAPISITANHSTSSSSSSSSGNNKMARSSVSRTRVVVRQSYYWPDQQLNFWIIMMLVTGGVLIGVFAQFVVIQQRLGGLGIPW